MTLRDASEQNVMRYSTPERTAAVQYQQYKQVHGEITWPAGNMVTWHHACTAGVLLYIQTAATAGPLVTAVTASWYRAARK
jgi:hypothetical protein